MSATSDSARSELKSPVSEMTPMSQSHGRSLDLPYKEYSDRKLTQVAAGSSPQLASPRRKLIRMVLLQQSFQSFCYNFAQLAQGGTGAPLYHSMASWHIWWLKYVSE